MELLFLQMPCFRHFQAVVSFAFKIYLKKKENHVITL